MLELLVVRHGQSIADIENRFEGRADFELTDLGIKQANQAASWINTYYRADYIISSPLKRARKTAETISFLCNVKVILEDEIMEWNNGLLAGLKREEGMKLYPLPQEGRKPHDTFAETESFIEFRSRAKTFISKLLSSNENQPSRICIVSHGGFINMLFRNFVRLPIDRNISISTGDTGIHLWQVNNTDRRIIYKNYQEHIRDL